MKNEYKKIVDSSVKAKLYYSDANPNYQNVSYSGKHFFFRDKSHTFSGGSVNSDIRKYIAALQRHSKCFFRSLKAFKVVLRVFVYAYNSFAQVKLDFPHLESDIGLIHFLPSL